MALRPDEEALARNLLLLSAELAQVVAAVHVARDEGDRWPLPLTTEQDLALHLAEVAAQMNVHARQHALSASLQPRANGRAGTVGGP